MLEFPSPLWGGIQGGGQPLCESKGRFPMTKILFPAIDLNSGPARRPKQLARKGAQTKKGIGRV